MDSIAAEFSAAAAGAEAFLNANPEGGGTGTSPTPPQQPAQQTQVASTPTPAPAVPPSTPPPAPDQPTPLALDDSKTYLWTNPVTGATEPKTGKEIKAGFMLQADYTRKTQEAAQLRKELEPYLSERQQALSLLQNPTQYLDFAAKHLGPQAVQQLTQAILAQQQAAQPQPQFDPNQIATVGQAQQIAEQRLQALQQQFLQEKQQLQEEIARAKQELRDETEVRRHNDVLEPAIKKVFEAHPILSAVPRVEDVIRFDVLAAIKRGEISTPEQAIQAFQTLAKQHSDALTAKFTELNKAQAVAQQSLVTNGIEPPGGTLLTHQGPQKPPLMPDGRLDWAAFDKGALDFINSIAPR